MKNLLLLFSIFVLKQNITNCQSFDIPKLGLKDIEMGFANIDPLRIKLIEQGFILMQEEESVNSDSYRPEWWRFMSNDVEVSISMTLNHYPDSKDISIDVNKNFQEYAKYLLSSIQKYFPEKKLIPGYESKDGYSIKKGFMILYYRKDSKIEIQYSENEEYFFFVIYWNYNIRNS